MKPVGDFTQRLWDSVSDIYEELLSSEFVIGLANGSLAEESFKHYLSQDVIYIKRDSQALANMSERAVCVKESSFFKRMSSDCIEIEDILHNEFMAFFSVKVAEKQSPAFANYSTFIEEMSHEAEYPIAVAALLPCFWLYGKVGHHILDTQSPNNKYQKFIDTYSGDEYIEYTREFINIMERHAGSENEYTQKEIIDAFVESSRHELNVFIEATNL